MAIEIEHKNNPSQTCEGLFAHINSTAYFLMNIFGVSVSEQNELKKIVFSMKNTDDKMTDPRWPVTLRGTDLQKVGIIHLSEAMKSSSDNKLLSPWWANLLSWKTDHCRLHCTNLGHIYTVD